MRTISTAPATPTAAHIARDGGSVVVGVSVGRVLEGGDGVMVVVAGPLVLAELLKDRDTVNEAIGVGVMELNRVVLVREVTSIMLLIISSPLPPLPSSDVVVGSVGVVLGPALLVAEAAKVENTVVFRAMLAGPMLAEAMLAEAMLVEAMLIEAMLVGAIVLVVFIAAVLYRHSPASQRRGWTRAAITACTVASYA